MEIIQYTLDRLDYNEQKINSILTEIQVLRNKLQNNTKFKFNNQELDLSLLLGSEAYRMKVAVSKSKSFTAACHLLDMSERTFYRKLKEYNIREELQLPGYG